jgi:ring-1,2-phenylacetyl-CoA epoxidase subunit PaaC
MNAHPVQTNRLLALADTCLLWGHRLSEWCGHGPELEEDIALTNISLDLIGHARALYQLYAERTGGDMTEDKLAYFRDVDEFQNVTLAEAENGDYAQTILRSLMLSIWFDTLWNQLGKCDDPQLAAIAREAAKSNAIALRHAREWTVRFGDGTEQSRQRIEAAIEALMPYYACLVGTEISGTQIDERIQAWNASMSRVLHEATLPMHVFSLNHPRSRAPVDRGVLARLLAEVQSLARQHPDAVW